MRFLRAAMGLTGTSTSENLLGSASNLCFLLGGGSGLVLESAAARNEE